MACHLHHDSGGRTCSSATAQAMRHFGHSPVTPPLATASSPAVATPPSTGTAAPHGNAAAFFHRLRQLQSAQRRFQGALAECAEELHAPLPAEQWLHVPHVHREQMRTLRSASAAAMQQLASPTAGSSGAKGEELVEANARRDKLALIEASYRLQATSAQVQQAIDEGLPREVWEPAAKSALRLAAERQAAAAELRCALSRCCKAKTH